ncbi:MAG TPA: hypothetical protein VGC54_06900 [Planctomycetota bacterium]
MVLPAEGFLRLGHSFLHWEGEDRPEPGDRVVDLGPARTRLEAWFAAGGRLGVQAISPLAEHPLEKLRDHALVAGGPAAALPGLCALAYGFGRVVLALPPEDREAFAACVRASRPVGEALVVDSLVDAPPRPPHHRALLGCAGIAPRPETIETLRRLLRPDGQLVLFGLPAAEVRGVFEKLAHDGLSLRGSGFHGDLAYLAGLQEHPTVLPA